MRSYALSKRAYADLSEIHRFGLARWGEAQADLYVQGLFAAFARIAAGTARSRKIAPEFGADGQFTTCDEHFIYWREQASGRIEIVTVVHQRRLQSLQVKTAFASR